MPQEKHKMCDLSGCCLYTAMMTTKIMKWPQIHLYKSQQWGFGSFNPAMNQHHEY